MVSRFDYKRPEELEKYLDSWGRIKPRRKTGLSPEEHREMARAVKRARYLALLPNDRRTKGLMLKNRSEQNERI